MKLEPLSEATVVGERADRPIRTAVRCRPLQSTTTDPGHILIRALTRLRSTGPYISYLDRLTDTQDLQCTMERPSRPHTMSLSILATMHCVGHVSKSPLLSSLPRPRGSREAPRTYTLAPPHRLPLSERYPSCPRQTPHNNSVASTGRQPGNA